MRACGEASSQAEREREERLEVLMYGRMLERGWRCE